MRKIRFFGVVAGLMMALTQPAGGAVFVPVEPIMPLSQVRPGMKGYGKTVFQGGKIVTFPVEILSVISKKDRPSELILIRASGADIDKAGGLASGMSGSPIYVNGRLVGAFAFGWNFGDPKMGLVTPIEQMATLFDYPDKIPEFPRAEHVTFPLQDPGINQRFNELYERYKGDKKKNVKEAPPAVESETNPLRGEEASQNEEFSVPQDIAALSADVERSYISADGLSRRAMKNLERRLGMPVLAGGSADTTACGDSVPAPQPGASISALLAWGDVTLDVSGTLTALDQSGRFVAFGHSFKNWGAVAYPVAEASVSGIIDSVEAPFKLSSPGRIIGMATQDRPEGVAGYLGKYPPAVSVRLDVEDRDTRRRSTLRFQMIRSDNAAVALLPDLLAGLVDRQLGSQTGGTIRYDVTVTGGGIPENWTVGDVVVDDEDVTAAAAMSMSALVGRVVKNPYRSLGSWGLKIDLSSTSKLRRLIIEGLTLGRGEVRAGSDLIVTMVFRPWREAVQRRKVRFHIPADTAPGNYNVTLRAGQPADHSDESAAPLSGDQKPQSFARMLREIQSDERACEVVLELSGSNSEGTEKNELPGEERRRKLREGSMRVFRSDCLAEGSIQVPLTVTSSVRSAKKAGKTLSAAK